jgi:two-component system cell cycle sensor histidine kinase/response regulator CckA
VTPTTSNPNSPDERRETLYFELSSLPLKTVDKDAEITRYNAAFRELLGFEEGDEIAPDGIVNLVHPEDIERGRRAFAELFDGRTSRAQFEVRLMRKDGSILWVQEIAVPQLDFARGPSTNPDYALVVSIDVTAQKEAERRIEQSERMRSIGQLSSSVAHDFNNILAILRSYVDILKYELETRQLRALLGPIAKLEQGIEQGVALTRQLTEFGRDTTAEDVPIDVNERIRNVNSLLGRYLSEAFEIRLELRPNLPPIRIAPGKLDQIILNLAVNARDAMPDGGKLRIRTFKAALRRRDARVHPTLELGEYLVLQVCDTGTGMDAETQRHIFEPFYTTKGSSGGTGLGLATVYRIMERLGGAIYVDSSPGRGTTFTMYFPAIGSTADADSDAAPSDAATESPDNRRSDSAASGDDILSGSAEPARLTLGPESAEQPANKRCILLVEDEDDLREPYRLFIEGDAVDGETRRVLEAGSFAQAQQMADALDRQLDLLIADVVLPDGTGVDLAEELTRRFPNLSVIFISGHAPDLIYRDTSRIQANWRFVPKPVSRNKLISTVRKVLDETGPGPQNPVIPTS